MQFTVSYSAVVVAFLWVSSNKNVFSCPCYNGGTCKDDECFCSVGFDGKRCQKNAMVSLFTSISARRFELLEAEGYISTANSIILDHINKNFELANSIFYLTCIGASVVEEMDEIFSSIKDEDLLPLTKGMATSLSYMITVLDIVGCISHAYIARCTTKREQCSFLILKCEENLVKMTNLYLGTELGDGDMITFNERTEDPVLSFTVIKTTGRDAPSYYESQYGSLALPYWETLQDHVGDARIAINVLSYKSNPYKYSNFENIGSSVIRVVITDTNGDELKLYDLEDLLTCTMDLSQVLSSSTVYTDMIHNGEEWKFVAYSNQSVEAIVVDVKLKSLFDCTVYGRYGWYHIYPNSQNYDIKVVTRGSSKIVSQIPWSLPIGYNNNGLQITIYNNRFVYGGYLPPLRMTMSCQDDDFSLETKIHQFRILEIKSYFLDDGHWTRSQSAKVDKVEGTNVVIKSSLFGTFAANSLLIPPNFIDFEEVFDNIMEKITTTPHILVVVLSVLLLSIPMTIFLRRMDKEDRYRWQYLPLIDNKDRDSHVYLLSVYTAVRSSGSFSSQCYFKIQGENASTRDRVLEDGSRKNFMRGTCCNFTMRTKENLGSLQKIIVWHNNSGGSPHWLLSKIVIQDALTLENFIFICGEWLSMTQGNCKTWTELLSLTSDQMTGSLMFNERCCRGLFDDHLWFSLTMRPNASTFTRIQRLWSIVALLFLSMVTSAMWFSSNPSLSIDDTNQKQFVTLGPFQLSYRMLYVGLFSSFLTFLPSFAIVFIFSNRQIRRKRHILEDSLQPQINDSKCLLPWWVIFVAYCLIGFAITASGFFTFLYSLEFGSGTTNDWLLSFICGTLQNIFLLEPCKVLFVAVGLSCLCTTSLHRLGFLSNILNCEDDLERRPRRLKNVKMYACPERKETKDLMERKQRQKLDAKLMYYLRSGALMAGYGTLLVIICSHNNITDSFWQNHQIRTAVNCSFKASTTNDIFVWLEDYFVPVMWPKNNANGSLKMSYDQRFMLDEYHYRVSLTQMRQIRRMDNCNQPIPSLMVPLNSLCSSESFFLQETTDNYCKGWTTDDGTCFDSGEVIDRSYRFKSSSDLNTLPYVGVFASYGGGGYPMEIGPKQSLVKHYLSELKKLNWIDMYTRALFINSYVYNANTRLLTKIQVVFEISEFGSIVMTTNTYSINMLPYITAWDYCVLVCQLVFMVALIIRISGFIRNIVKHRLESLKMFETWLRLTEVCLSMSAVVFYILRIDHTLQGVKDSNNYLGSLESYDHAMLYDKLYQETIAGVMFIVFLGVLKPLTFNSHLCILYFSLSNGRNEIFSFLFIFLIAITAFASYLHVTVGYLVYDFRSPLTATLAMMQILLAMISLRKHPELSSLNSQIAISFFSFIMTLVFVNFFISMLNCYFTNGKENLQNSMPFLQKLNKHFWKRLDSLFRWLGEVMTIKKTMLSDANNEMKSEKEIFHEILKDLHLCKESITDLMKELRDILRIRLDCLILRKANIIQCRFYSEESREFKFTLTSPSMAVSVISDLTCYECNILFYTAYLPSDQFMILPKMFELRHSKPTCPQGVYTLEILMKHCEEYQFVLCSFDRGQHWNTVLPEKTVSSLKWTFSELPSHFTLAK